MTAGSRSKTPFPHRWAVMFLVAVGFWNFVGAGIFGFLVNLPIVSYYEIGTALTANHGHAAMMGVYGMLALGWRGRLSEAERTRSPLAFDALQRAGEIGIHTAIGATRGDLVWMVVREGLLLVAAGIAIGLPGRWKIISSGSDGGAETRIAPEKTPPRRTQEC